MCIPMYAFTDLTIAMHKETTCTSLTSPVQMRLHGASEAFWLQTLFAEAPPKLSETSVATATGTVHSQHQNYLGFLHGDLCVLHYFYHTML